MLKPQTTRNDHSITSHLIRPVHIRRAWLALTIATMALAFPTGASASSGIVEGSISWARSHLGQDYDDGWCLLFVHDAYLRGGRVNIGGAYDAVDYWHAHPDAQHRGDDNPPRGALVFWGATSTNAYGHVGISLGGGLIISTASYPKTTANPDDVHIFSLAARGARAYLGWMAPPGVSLAAPPASSPPGPTSPGAPVSSPQPVSEVAPGPGPTPSEPVTPAPPQTFAETTGGGVHTWTNYSNAGGSEGPEISSNATVQIQCKVTGFAVADGNTWWYRIASSPWNGSYYGSADAFYNNGETSGSLLGTPFVDPAVPNC